MTKRERQIIELIAKGMTNKKIAENIHISPYTVKSHVHNILEKLAIHSRIQIATQSAQSAPSRSRRDHFSAGPITDSLKKLQPAPKKG